MGRSGKNDYPPSVTWTYLDYHRLSTLPVWHAMRPCLLDSERHNDMYIICIYIYYIYIIYLSICLFIFLFIYIFIYSFIYLFIHSFIYSCIHLSIHAFIYLFVYLFIQQRIQLHPTFHRTENTVSMNLWGFPWTSPSTLLQRESQCLKTSSN